MKYNSEFEMRVMKKRAERVVRNLKKRQINGCFFENVEDGIQKVLQLIPEGSTVGLGGSTTVIESGLINELRNSEIQLLDRYAPGVSKDEINRMRAKSMSADVFIASTNAITVDGKLVNVDGMGNRVAAMIYGPKKVILFTGTNKIVDSVEQGIKRVHSLAAPANVQRFGAGTPCRDSGFCERERCRSPKSICNKYSVIEGEFTEDRMHVVIVGAKLGF